MGVSVTQYALLYSLYSWPNVILSVFGGYLIDRVLGVRLGTLIFSGFVCLGQVNNLPPSPSPLSLSSLPLLSPSSLSPLPLNLLPPLCSWSLHWEHLLTSTG